MTRTARLRRAPAAGRSWPRGAALAARRKLPGAAMARGAAGLAGPLLAGTWTGWGTLSVVAAVGALWGTGQDGGDVYSSRIRRLAWTAITAALGYLFGELALRSDRPAAVTLCLVAAGFIAGLISLHGRIASVAGMHLLLGAVIGAGIPVPGPWWQPPLALLSGALWVCLLSALPWLWARHDIERAAVTTVYRVAGEALAMAGTQAAEEARRRLTDALDAAHRAMSGHLASGERVPGQTDLGRLVHAFRIAVLLGEAVTTLLWEARPLQPAVTCVPQMMAAQLLPRRRNTAGPQPVIPGGLSGHGQQPAFEPDSSGVWALADLWAAASQHRVDDLPLQPPAGSLADRTAQLRYATLLTVCVLIAQWYATTLNGPRGYWLPMTVAFIYKPDFGPLFRRALHRCAGTVAGAVIIGPIAFLTDSVYAFIAVAAVFGALMAIGVRHHYAIATTGLTAIVFVLLDLLGDHRNLYGPRILDTALAAAIVLFVHFAVWPDSAAAHAEQQTRNALIATRRYLELAPGAPLAQRHALRRTAYQQLAEARRVIDDALSEPLRPGRPRPDWERSIAAAERLCDLVTARGSVLRHAVSA